MSNIKNPAPPQKPHPLRRQYLVKKRYQGRFIALFSTLALVVGILTAIMVYIVTKRALLEALYRIHLPSGELWYLIRQPLIVINLLIAGVSFLIATFVIIIIIRRSIRLLRIIETEIQTIDTPGKFKSSKEAEQLWSGISRETSNNLQQLIHPFAEAADALDNALVQFKQALQSDLQPKKLLLDEINAAIAQIDVTVGKFRY